MGFFRDILRRCIEKGLVDGRTQAVDSAPIKANASISGLAERELAEKSKDYFDGITANEEASDGSGAEKSVKSRKPPTSYNERYASPADPATRASHKKGKPLAMNHLGIVSVDAESHVICGAAADYADKKDCETTEKIMGQTIENLAEHGISVENMLADAGYSSGETFKYLEGQGITAYIPANAAYKSQRDGFSYDGDRDCYVCRNGVELHFKKMKAHSGRDTYGKLYRSRAKDCKNCPSRAECCKNQKCKQIEETIAKPYYDAARERMATAKGKRMRRLRSATVEPVLGTLLCFKRMRKVYAKGNESAQKQLLMAAAAYNLKKLMSAMSFKGVDAAAKAVKEAVLDKIQAWEKSIPFRNAILATQ